MTLYQSAQVIAMNYEVTGSVLNFTQFGPVLSKLL